jgi:hypothetical protein
MWIDGRNLEGEHKCATSVTTDGREYSSIVISSNIEGT